MTDNGQLNQQIADAFNDIAELLELQDANPFRVRSYRRAAGTLEQTGRDVATIIEDDGKDALEDLEGIGNALANQIAEYVDSGRLSMLERLRAETDPEAVLEEVPGIGPELAGRIHEELGVDSLEDLEQAAHDGRLRQVDGMGADRVDGVRKALAGMLSRQRRDRDGDVPDIATLLDVDREYRDRAAAGDLRRIAPKRFNPNNEAWLPILETERGDWSFTALYSNTARAHDLGKTDDWVVLYYRRDGGAEGQCTVVTGSRGKLDGRRIVRGREGECRDYYTTED